MRRSFVGLVSLAALGVFAATALIGLVALWPGDRTIDRPPSLRTPDTLQAEVVGVALVDCRTPGRDECFRVRAELREGPDEGKVVAFTLGDAGGPVDIDVGDRVRVYENPLPEGAVIGGVSVDRYALSDFERRSPLLWLAVGFALLVVLTGRWQGLRALIGLGASLAVVLAFVAPAILDGASPVTVALVGALTIMFLTIPLAHGLGPKTVAACLGTGVSLLLVLGLADAFTRLAHLTGLSSDEAIFLRASGGDVSIRGLLLAGMVIGALGVLDDLTVTQASIVLALRRANPELGLGRLFASAVSVGRDHIAATVNTLVLAYVGASLPVLLIFSLAGTSFGDALNSEAVAQEVVGMLVGSIGLIAAVPVTTGIAVLLATRLSGGELARAGAHAH